jgi:ABC-type antimicrobial peptide transport system permease subunit
MVYWDEELRSVVQPLEKSLSLLQVLYPVTVIVAVLIGLGLNLLLVMQSARDAAILRVLGVSTGRVRGMYTIQQLLLSLFGVFMGLAGVAILRSQPAALLEKQLIFGVLLFLGGALLGALLGVYLTTNKNPLALLQVKE